MTATRSSGLMQSEALHAAAENFVKPGFRARFVHEALKKPSKLRARVCHETDRVFQARYKGGQVRGVAGERWHLLDNDAGFREASWEEVGSRMKLGIGMLAIDARGARFYAESEDSSGMEVWAGEI